MQLVRVPDVGVPRTGVTNVALVVPAKDTVPDWPDSVVFTALLVAILYPYAITSSKYPCINQAQTTLACVVPFIKSTLRIFSAGIDQYILVT